MTRHESRVTIDVDGYHPDFEIRAIRAYHELDRLADRVDVHVSSSGNGIHVEAFFEERLSERAKESLRRTLGDDPTRVHLDGVRATSGHTTQVLWTEKNGQHAHRGFSDVYDALDHIAATDDHAARLKRDVQQGWVV